MKSKGTPDRDILLASISYDPDSGVMTWKQRESWTFNPGGERCEYHVAKVWNSNFAGKEAFTSYAKNGYKKGSFNGENYYAHRIIWKMITGLEPEDIDHIDGVRHNNAISNLRSTSRSENLKNRRLSSNNKSGYHGVCYSNRHRLWTASIGNGGQYIHLGWFKNKSDAVDARIHAEAVYGYHENHGRS